jgi:hypothetical protein
MFANDEPGTSLGRATDPQIGFDAAGNALAIWNRFDGTNESNTSSGLNSCRQRSRDPPPRHRWR